MNNDSFARMKKSGNAYLIMHFCILLWGFTAILGRLIELREFMLVFYRMWITVFILLLLPGTLSFLKTHSFRKTLPLLGIGMLVACHWVCFYGSVKYANASVAAACIGVVSFFTAILEPIMLRKPFVKENLILGFSIIPGIWLISDASPAGYFTGIVLGIISSLLAASFSVLNKKYASEFHPLSLTWLEMTGGALLLSLILPLYAYFLPEFVQLPDAKNFGYLALLSVGCTIVPFALSIYALRHISAFTSVFLLNLEPLYSIILAIILLQENQELSLQFYLGAGWILMAVSLHSWWSRRNNVSEAAN